MRPVGLIAALLLFFSLATPLAAETRTSRLPVEVQSQVDKIRKVKEVNAYDKYRVTGLAADYGVLRRKIDAIRKVLRHPLPRETKRELQAGLARAIDQIQGIMVPEDKVLDPQALRWGVDKVKQDYKAWFPQFIQEPEIAENLLDAAWDGGDPQIRQTGPSRYYPLQQLPLLMGGKYEDQALRLILDSRIVEPARRYELLLEIAIANPGARYQRLFQNEFLRRLDTLRRFGSEDFKDDGQGKKLTEEALNNWTTTQPLASLPGDWLTSALLKLAASDDFDVGVSQAALRVLAQRADKFPLTQKQINPFSLQLLAYTGSSRRMQLLSESAVFNLPPLREADLLPLARILKDGSNREALLQSARSKISYPITSPESKKALAEALRLNLQNEKGSIRLYAMNLLDDVLGKDSIPFLLESLRFELQRPAGLFINSNVQESERLIAAAAQKLPDKNARLEVFLTVLREIGSAQNPDGTKDWFHFFPIAKGVLALLEDEDFSFPLEARSEMIKWLSLSPPEAGYSENLDYLKAMFALDQLAPAATPIRSIHDPESVKINLQYLLDGQSYYTKSWDGESRSVDYLNAMDRSLPKDHLSKVADKILNDTEKNFKYSRLNLGAFFAGQTFNADLSTQLLDLVTTSRPEPLHYFQKAPGREDTAFYDSTPLLRTVLGSLGKIAERFPKHQGDLDSAIDKNREYAPLLVPLPWESQLKEIKELVIRERQYWLHHPEMLEGEFAFESSVNAQDGVMPTAILKFFYRRGEECDDEARVELQANNGEVITQSPVKAHGSGGFFEKRGALYHWSPEAYPSGPIQDFDVLPSPPRLAVQVRTDYGSPDLEFKFYNLKRVPFADSGYDEKVWDPCGKIAEQLPEKPVLSRAFLLRACVSYFWPNTPFDLKRSLLLEMKYHGSAVGQDTKTQTALMELWSTIVVSEKTPGLIRFALEEISVLPVTVNPEVVKRTIENIEKKLSKPTTGAIPYGGCFREEIARRISSLKKKLARPFQGNNRPVLPRGVTPKAIARPANATHGGRKQP